MEHVLVHQHTPSGPRLNKKPHAALLPEVITGASITWASHAYLALRGQALPDLTLHGKALGEIGTSAEVRIGTRAHEGST